jgi:hypothetical protein
VQFRVLGPLEVWDEEGQLDLGGRWQSALLALLFLRRNEVVPVDRPMDVAKPQEWQSATVPCGWLGSRGASFGVSMRVPLSSRQRFRCAASRRCGFRGGGRLGRRRTGGILKIDPETNTVVKRIPITGVPKSLAFGLGRLSVALD